MTIEMHYILPKFQAITASSGVLYALDLDGRIWWLAPAGWARINEHVVGSTPKGNKE